MIAAIVVCGLMAVGLSVAAWKLPKVRAGLVAAAAAVAGVAALLVALVAAGGDMKRARRSVQQKRQIKTALKDHKASLIAEHKRVADVQDRIDAIADPAEPAETLDLDALADRTNSP